MLFKNRSVLITGSRRGVAGEVARHGIRVNTVSPGLTLTEATSDMPETRKFMITAINPIRRLGKAEDRGILLLASDLPAISIPFF